MHTAILLFAFLFAGSFGLTLLLVPLFTRVALSRGIVDMPNGRKVHTKPIPRIGGMAIFISRITSYNVCYTKLLRPVGKIRTAERYVTGYVSLC